MPHASLAFQQPPRSAIFRATSRDLLAFQRKTDSPGPHLELYSLFNELLPGPLSGPAPLALRDDLPVISRACNASVSNQWRLVNPVAPTSLTERRGSLSARPAGRHRHFLRPLPFGPGLRGSPEVSLRWKASYHPLGPESTLFRSVAPKFLLPPAPHLLDCRPPEVAHPRRYPQHQRLLARRARQRVPQLQR